MPGWHSVDNHGAAPSTCVDFTATMTSSTDGMSCAGSICTGPGTMINPSLICNSNCERAVRPQSIGVRPASCSAAATVVPIAPGPTMATEGGEVGAGSENSCWDMPLGYAITCA